MAKRLCVAAACLLSVAHAPAFARDGLDSATAPAKGAADRQVRLAAADLSEPSNPDSLALVGTAGHRLVGQVKPSGNTTLGIGVWRVEKSDRNDPNRSQPMRDRRGRLSGTAGLGFNIGF